MPDEEAPKETRETKEKLPARPAGAVSASGTHAVIVAQPAAPPGPALPKISRRQMVIGGFWSALTGLTAISVAALINFMWPRQAQKAGGTFVLDVNANDIPEGEKAEYIILQPSKSDPLKAIETKLYIVHLSQTQAELNKMPEKAGAYLALWRKCPHLGCSVPFEPGFTFPDPANGGQPIRGWFRCPCHGSTYSDSGRRVFGPAPRSMDVFPLQIAADGTMTVELSAIQGATEIKPDNPGNITHAVKPGETPA
jgi:cytochrome b6-f complex iron-sulfur subunit